MDKRQTEIVKGLTLANEFLKILRSFKLEQQHDTPIPDEIKESLANAQLNLVMEKYNSEPEDLVWGLVQVIEMFLKLTDTDPEDLSGALDQFTNYVEEQEKDKWQK
jgi:hypothetical protein